MRWRLRNKKQAKRRFLASRDLLRFTLAGTASVGQTHRRLDLTRMVSGGRFSLEVGRSITEYAPIRQQDRQRHEHDDQTGQGVVGNHGNHPSANAALFR